MRLFQAIRKPPVHIGLVLVALGLAFRRVIELALAPDHQIVKPAYISIIYIIQVLIIVGGVFLLVKQPTLRMPSRAEVALSVASLTLTLGLLEVSARVWLIYLATPDLHDRFSLFTSEDASQFTFTPHPYLSYYPTPSFAKGLTTHNSLGYRNDEFPVEKPNGVFRIVALGGSSTYDVRIADNDKTFTAQLQHLLRDKYGFQNVEIINAGVPGYNSWEILVNLEFRVLDLDPDLVIIYEGTNDVHARMVAPGAYRGDNTGRRQAWQAPSIAWWEHSALLRILARSMNLSRQVGIDDFVSAPTYMSWPYDARLAAANLTTAELLAENPPIYFQRNLENMVAIAQAHDVDILLSTWAYSPYLNDYAAEAGYQQGFQENNRVVRQVAESYGVPLFDFAAVMPQEARFWADGRHVNEEGALAKASLFSAYLVTQGLLD